MAASEYFPLKVKDFKLMKSFVNDLYHYDYTGEQAENNEEESGDDEEIDIKLKGEGNATNENNENVIEIGYPFLLTFIYEQTKHASFS